MMLGFLYQINNKLRYYKIPAFINFGKVPILKKVKNIKFKPFFPFNVLETESARNLFTPNKMLWKFNNLLLSDLL